MKVSLACSSSSCCSFEADFVDDLALGFDAGSTTSDCSSCFFLDRFAGFLPFDLLFLDDLLDGAVMSTSSSEAGDFSLRFRAACLDDRRGVGAAIESSGPSSVLVVVALSSSIIELEARESCLELARDRRSCSSVPCWCRSSLRREEPLLASARRGRFLP